MCWFENLVSTTAPRNDLALQCTLSTYPNKEVAKAATTTFNRHYWCLSELLVRFGFFDDDVTIEKKQLMVVALKEKKRSKAPLKHIMPVLGPAKRGLHDFVTTSTVSFFKTIGLSEDFLQRDPNKWKHDEQCRRNKEVAQSVMVVNDLAESEVVLVQEFNSSLIRNEEQKQYLLQVVEDHF